MLGEQILNAYRSLFALSGLPEWAYEGIPANIPFIGDKFQPGEGIFLDASADNLSYPEIDWPLIFKPDLAWNTKIDSRRNGTDYE